MIGRPAGMSDDESEDDEGFSFHNDKLSQCTSHINRTVVAEAKPINTHSNFAKNQKCLLRMMNACMAGDLKIIDEYIQSYDVNDFLHSGWTPLLYAASSANPETVEYLLSLGADPNKHDGGYTPVMALCNSTKGTVDNCLRCLVMLIQAKGDVNTTNKNKETALMYACKSREPEVVQELLKHTKDINACDSEGHTALFYAVTANKPDILKILLDNKADTSYQDKRGQTAKDIALLKGYEKIATLLNPESDEILNSCETAKICSWSDLFPTLYDMSDQCVNFDVACLLFGMGLERYSKLFQGMNLSTFLQLTDDDLIQLGMDISLHRKQFQDGLYKFHIKKWNVRSIGAIKKKLPYTIYDGVISLGNTAKQINIINASFQYIKNNLQNTTDLNTILTSEQISEYNEQLRKIQQTLMTLKKELYRVRTLAEKINKEDNLGPPATYIGRKKKRSNWTVILSIMLITGIYVSKTTYAQRLWN